MDVLTAYSSGDEVVEEELDTKIVSLPSAKSAPNIDTTGFALQEATVVTKDSTKELLNVNQRQIVTNIPYKDLNAPIVGPLNPYTKDGLPSGQRNHKTGHVEDTYINPAIFDDQFRTMNKLGYCHDPSGSGGVVGDVQGYNNQNGESVLIHQTAKKRKSTAEKLAEKEAKLARLEEIQNDPESAWAPPEREGWEDVEALEVRPITYTEEEWEFVEKYRKEREEKISARQKAIEDGNFRNYGRKDTDMQEKDIKSTLHIKQNYNWMETPKSIRKENERCYLPKRQIHVWAGHSNAVNCIRFFPVTGHLLLSAALDGKVKIWDVFNDKKCIQTYIGHNKGVREVKFTNDGTKFVSCAYDKFVRLWDTETGKVIQTINNGRTFNCATFHPDDAKQNTIMLGSWDKKIYQYDLNSGDLVQEYDYHLDRVLTITFVDEGRRFVSTSDDRTVRIWEFGIPVEIKQIADPGMHSLPSVALHPNKQYMIAQSMDNKVVTYSTKERFKLNKRKAFRGHLCAGNACQVNFSPDGRFVLSGDANGNVFMWDWERKGIVRMINAHPRKVCIGVEWHPLETSKVATCGWDGQIKYWD